MLTVNIKQADFDRLIKKAKTSPKAFAMEFVQDLVSEVIKATPVRTGFLRASWFAEINDEPSGAGGAGGEGAMMAAAVNMKPGDRFIAVNTAAYAAFVEFGTRKMSPRAFVHGTVARAAAIAEA